MGQLLTGKTPTPLQHARSMSGLPTEPAALKAKFERCASQNVRSMEALMSSEVGDVVRSMQANEQQMGELAEALRETDPTAAATWLASYYRTPVVEAYRGRCSSCCVLEHALMECCQMLWHRTTGRDLCALSNCVSPQVYAYLFK